MRETIREQDDELQAHHDTLLAIEQGMIEKEGEMDSLQEEVQKMRREVLEKDRILAVFGRDVQRLVALTDPDQIKDGIRGIYRKIVKDRANRTHRGHISRVH